MIPPGDAALRADIQVLADYGVVKGPVTSWPLAWGPILADIDEAARGSEELPAHVLRALTRVRDRASWETKVNAFQYNARIAAAEKTAAIRSFADTPRETVEVGGGFSWTGNWLSITVNGQVVTSPDDEKEYRADNSMIGVTLGNFSVAASTMDRWWGPGWDGSLILSSNARPMARSRAVRRVEPGRGAGCAQYPDSDRTGYCEPRYFSQPPVSLWCRRNRRGDRTN